MSDRNTLGLNIRNATSADELSIAVLGMQVFLDTYATEGIRDALAREVLEAFSPEKISSLIARPDIALLVAQARGHLLGFAQIAVRTDHPMIGDPDAAELQRLYVQERFTGHGIGWQLLERAQVQAASRGASRLWATVWTGNHRAMSFYPRQGYWHAGSPVYRLQDEVHENALFCKAL